MNKGKWIMWIVFSILILIIVVLIRVNSEKQIIFDTHQSDSLRVILKKNALIQIKAEAEKDSLKRLLVINDSIIKVYEKKKNFYKSSSQDHGRRIDSMDVNQLIEYSRGTSVGEPDYIIVSDPNK